MNTPSRIAPPLPQQVLDPCHLGRPVHLLPVFTAALRDDLAELFRTGMNRRYRASFDVADIAMTCAATPEHSGRWWSVASPVGRIGLALHRSVLLAALEYRYGTRNSTSNSATNGAPSVPAEATISTEPDAPVRETSTEERLAAMLGAQLVAVVAARIDADLPEPHAVAATFAPAITSAPPAAGTWTIRVTIKEAALGIEGAVWFTLDDAWMARLLHRLVVNRPRVRDAETLPLAARLQLTVAGRLLRRDMPLGELIDVRVGDVIPVSLGATDVLIDDSRLFRAVVAERNGKLCLTSFEDVE